MTEDHQIRYILFPEKQYTESILDEITEVLVNPQKREEHNKHNIEVTRQRYSRKVMHRASNEYLNQLLLSK